MGSLFFAYFHGQNIYLKESVIAEGFLKGKRLFMRLSETGSGIHKENERNSIDKDSFLLLFPNEFYSFTRELLKMKGQLYEIRIRKMKPLSVYTDKGLFYVGGKGEICTNPAEAYVLSEEAVDIWINHLCRYSLYAYQDAFTKGYFTVAGGHRIGVVGQVVLKDGEIASLKYICSMNIRIAHEKKGASEALLSYLFRENALGMKEFCSTLIVSPPMWGKTTILRDLIRSLASDADERIPYKIGVVDERGELGADYLGILQNDLGFASDVYTNCPKKEGITNLLRSMSPEIIALDELATKEDCDAVGLAFGHGCKIIATMHGDCATLPHKHPYIGSLCRVTGFERIILLYKVRNTTGCETEHLAAVYDMDGKCLKKDINV